MGRAPDGGSAGAADGMSPATAHAGGDPSRWVVRWSHLIAAGGPVLDVAAGAGRHACWFAMRGHPVVALERDLVALGLLGVIPGVEAIAADLEDGSPWPISGERLFSAVVVTNYLHRPLLPRLIHALGPGGILLYETFARGNGTVGKPSNPAFLLAPGELLDVARGGGLRVVAFEDGFVANPRAAFIQRICAVKEAAVPAASNGPIGSAAAPRYDLAV